MTAWQATPLSTTPASLAMATTEDRRPGLDASPLLAVGETIDNAKLTARLVRLDTFATVALADSPTHTTGNIIVQRVRGSALARGVVYELTVTFGITGDPSELRSMVLVIACVA
jgi:hypothetical protein